MSEEKSTHEISGLLAALATAPTALKGSSESLADSASLIQFNRESLNTKEGIQMNAAAMRAAMAQEEGAQVCFDFLKSVMKRKGGYRVCVDLILEVMGFALPERTADRYKMCQAIIQKLLRDKNRDLAVLFLREAIPMKGGPLVWSLVIREMIPPPNLDPKMALERHQLCALLMRNALPRKHCEPWVISLMLGMIDLPDGQALCSAILSGVMFQDDKNIREKKLINAASAIESGGRACAVILMEILRHAPEAGYELCVNLIRNEIAPSTQFKQRYAEILGETLRLNDECTPTTQPQPSSGSQIGSIILYEWINRDKEAGPQVCASVLQAAMPKHARAVSATFRELDDLNADLSARLMSAAFEQPDSIPLSIILIKEMMNREEGGYQCCAEKIVEVAKKGQETKIAELVRAIMASEADEKRKETLFRRLFDEASQLSEGPLLYLPLTREIIKNDWGYRTCARYLHELMQTESGHRIGRSLIEDMQHHNPLGPPCTEVMREMIWQDYLHKTNSAKSLFLEATCFKKIVAAFDISLMVRLEPELINEFNDGGHPDPSSSLAWEIHSSKKQAEITKLLSAKSVPLDFQQWAPYLAELTVESIIKMDSPIIQQLPKGLKKCVSYRFTKVLELKQLLDQFIELSRQLYDDPSRLSEKTALSVLPCIPYRMLYALQDGVAGINVETVEKLIQLKEPLPREELDLSPVFEFARRRTQGDRTKTLPSMDWLSQPFRQTTSPSRTEISAEESSIDTRTKTPPLS